MEDKIIGFKINSKGYGTVPKLLMQDRNICIGAKGLYSYFCSYSGCGDTCFPTRKKVCFDLNISIDTFGKYLKQLVENGYMKVEQIKENGRFSHNIYTLNDTILPCTKISDTVNSVYEKTDTNNNNNKNNKINNINNTGVRGNEKKFSHPTQEEVKEYCKERNSSIDPEHFYAFYESKGWKVGNNPMQNWKAAVITWEKRDLQNKPQQKQSNLSYTTEEYERMIMSKYLDNDNETPKTQKIKNNFDIDEFEKYLADKYKK